MRRDNKSNVKRSNNSKYLFTTPAFSGQGQVPNATWSTRSRPKSLGCCLFGCAFIIHKRFKTIEIWTRIANTHTASPLFFHYYLLFVPSHPQIHYQQTKHEQTLIPQDRFPKNGQLHAVYLIVTLTIDRETGSSGLLEPVWMPDTNTPRSCATKGRWEGRSGFGVITILDLVHPSSEVYVVSNNPGS